MVAPTVREQLLNPHELWMLSTLGLSAGLALVRSRHGPSLPEAGASSCCSCSSSLPSWLRARTTGGWLVYDYNEGGSACGQPIEFTR